MSKHMLIVTFHPCKHHLPLLSGREEVGFLSPSYTACSTVFHHQGLSLTLGAPEWTSLIPLSPLSADVVTIYQNNNWIN